MCEKIIAACGNDCAVCPRYNVPPYTKTAEELHHTAELWYKIGYRDHVVTNEEDCLYRLQGRKLVPLSPCKMRERKAYRALRPV